MTSQLAETLQRVRTEIRFCSQCGALAAGELCEICLDTTRDPALICVVAEAADVLAIERSGALRVQYHVLGGLLSPLDGIGPDELRLTPLLQRLQQLDRAEVCIATNPTVEGDVTADWLQDQIRRLIPDTPVRITRIAHGIATGGEIEFADSQTLAHSIQGRKEL